jgi:diguanylate cyclase
MANIQTPIEIARQTLKNLALSKVPPTPDNFRRAYEEISGVRSEDPIQVLIRLLKEAGRGRPKFSKLSTQLQQATGVSNLAEVETLLRQLLPSGKDGESGHWGEVLRDLIRELEISRPGMSISKKKEGLERLLTNFGADVDVLEEKILALVASWKSGGKTAESLVDGGETVAAAAAEPTGTSAPLPSTSLAGQWRDLLVKTLEFGLLSQLKYLPELARNAQRLLEQARAAATEKEVAKLAEDFKGFWYKLEMNSDAQFRLHEELLQVMRLLVDNMNELVVDDQWLHGQTQMLREIIEKPLDIEVLYDAESSLKELIFKQGKLKHGLIEARETLKQMAASFVERLAEMTENTGEFHDKIGVYQQRLSKTEDIAELNVILDSIMQDTRAMQLDALRARDHLQASQKEVRDAEQRIQQLTNELLQLSEAAHQDFLTGTLNRRGMEEAFLREFNRAERSGQPISIALLDVDHFKKLNDSLGHEAGDVALVHLAKVVKNTLRPTDVLARYGGEEFVIILPQTDQDGAIVIMSRVQRELTKNFFLHNNQKVLITFSAGVAERLGQEQPDDVIKRADLALYQAKHAGRNRVIGAAA